MEREFTKKGRMMSILEFIKKQLKYRYEITEIQCLDEIHGEPELVVVPFDRHCSMDKVIGKIRKVEGITVRLSFWKRTRNRWTLLSEISRRTDWI